MINLYGAKYRITGRNIAMCIYLFVYLLLPFLTIILWDERVIIYLDDIG